MIIFSPYPNKQQQQQPSHSTPFKLFLCCSGMTRLAPSRVVIYLWHHSKEFIYYHNHHLQKQCVDMAPHSLEQMSQTFTTIYSVTIHFYSLCWYPNYAPFVDAIISFHLTWRTHMPHHWSCSHVHVRVWSHQIWALMYDTRCRTWTQVYSCTQTCPLSTCDGMYHLCARSHCVAHATSPITFVCVRAGTIPSFNHHQ